MKKKMQMLSGLHAEALGSLSLFLFFLLNYKTHRRNKTWRQNLETKRTLLKKKNPMSNRQKEKSVAGMACAEFK